MARSKRQTPSGRAACIAALAAAQGPLTATEIATVVVDSGVVPTLKGKTPKATLSAQITSGAKKGEIFKRVGSKRPARFTLKDGVEANDELVETLRAKVAELAASQKTEQPEAKPDPKPSARSATATA